MQPTLRGQINALRSRVAESLGVAQGDQKLADQEVVKAAALNVHLARQAAVATIATMACFIIAGQCSII